MTEFVVYYDHRKLTVDICDLLGAPVDAIVNPANPGLSHGGGLAAVISDEAGPGLDEECGRIIEKVGRIPVGLAVPTKAYNLPYKGIIHAVGPRMGDDDVEPKIGKTIESCLTIADKKGWRSLAFPALGTGIYMVLNTTCARAFKSAIPDFFDNNPDSCVNNVYLCLFKDAYQEFRDVLLD